MKSGWNRWIQSLLLLAVLSPSMVAAADRNLTVTVYNRDIALVRENREFSLDQGVTEVRVTDVAAGLDPTSVHLVPRRAGAFRVLEQNFQFDLANTDRLLQRSLGQEIRATGKDGEVTVGKLVFFDGASLVLESGGEVHMVYRNDLREQIISELPGGLVSKPTLAWLIDAGRQGSAEGELSYLTRGMSWHAEYVAVINPQDSGIALSSWVSIVNSSGASYPDARLKLVAGDINLVRRQPQARTAMRTLDSVAEGAPFSERGFFEFHLYDLQRPTTIADRETKQISLFPTAAVRNVEKNYTLDATRRGPKIWVTLKFNNRESDGLGIALPAGKVRIYKEDEDGSQEFVGEDLIDHTPRDEEVELTVGKAFDVVAERKQTNFRRLSNRVTESSFSIEIRNRKDEAIDVRIVEHPGGDWEVTESSMEYEKTDATTIEYLLSVPARSESTVTYTVRMQS